MAYEDIAPDSGAVFAYDFNGDFTNTGYQTLTSETLPTAGTYSFVNDHPFDATKQSIQKAYNTGSASILSGIFNSDLNVSGNRGTIEFWFKYTASTTGVIPSFANIFDLEYRDSTYGNVSYLKASINGGTSYAATGAGALDIGYRASTTSTSRRTSYKYSPNQWHCVHIEQRYDAGSGLNRERLYIYVDGVLDNTTAAGFTGSATGISGFRIILPAPAAAGQTINIAEARHFQSRLTKEQKVLRAKYGTATIGYENTVLADSPKMLLKMDNATKTDPVTIYGTDAAAWGGELVQGTTAGKGQINFGSQITVNEAGPKGDKAWKWNVNGSGSGWIANQTATKMQELWRDNTKSVTFEWMSTSPAYDLNVATNAAANVLRFNPATAGNGRLTVAMPAVTATPTTGTIGQNLPTLVEYWSGTAWVTGSLSSLGGDVASSNQTNYSQHADNQWHHNVLIFDRTTTTLSVYYYFDGWLSRYRTFPAGSNAQYTAGSGWGNSVAWFFGPDNSPITTARTVSFDNFAVYDKILTPEQIRQHFYAYAAAEPVATGVKAWNGTAWVDSTAQYVWNGTDWVDWNGSYYDGTQWVAI